MNEMNLGKRERGSKDGACRFQTLLGRYFKKEVKEEQTEKGKEGNSCIERGTIVSIDRLVNRLFVVTVVWKVSGNKWFPSKIGNNPKWARGVATTNFRFGVREVKLTGRDLDLIYMSIDLKADAGGVEHGVNVHDCYRMIVMSDITAIRGKVDI